jgi:hypothetical protein
MNDLKAKTPCADCGGFFEPPDMDWDHLPDFEKSEQVSYFVHHGLRERAEEEMKKCELVSINRGQTTPYGNPRFLRDALGPHPSDADERRANADAQAPGCLETSQNGGGGIRTLVGGKPPETVFETAAFNRSATPPRSRPGGRTVILDARVAGARGRDVAPRHRSPLT